MQFISSVEVVVGFIQVSERQTGESWNGKWELSERFTDKEASRRRALSEVTRSADEGVARWSAVYQFSGGSGRFYPGFRKADRRKLERKVGAEQKVHG